MTTPEDPKLEKSINEAKWRREYSKAYYSKKKAEPPPEEEREDKLIERAKNFMEQRKIYNARASTKIKAYKEANGIEIRKPGRQPKPKEDVPKRLRGRPRKVVPEPEVVV